MPFLQGLLHRFHSYTSSRRSQRWARPAVPKSPDFVASVPSFAGSDCLQLPLSRYDAQAKKAPPVSNRNRHASTQQHASSGLSKKCVVVMKI